MKREKLSEEERLKEIEETNACHLAKKKFSTYHSRPELDCCFYFVRIRIMSISSFKEDVTNAWFLLKWSLPNSVLKAGQGPNFGFLCGLYMALIMSLEWNEEQTEEQGGAKSPPVVVNDPCAQRSKKKKDNPVNALIISVLSLSVSRDNHRYKKRDRIPLFANIVYPPNNKCEAFPYFKLPFCSPGYKKLNLRKIVSVLDMTKSLEEVLEGDCFTNTLYQLNFKVEKIEETLCEKNLSKEEVAKFRHAVRNNFEYKMHHNNIQMRGKVGNIGESSTLRYYLTTHIDFHAYYFRDRVEDIYITSDYLTGADISDDAAVKLSNYRYLIISAHIHSDGCRCPPYTSLLGAILGIGT
ncbi:Transmembrane 9 superfamily member 3 [Camellia lanceoleosa]|uniref:Transmembrane 9 superfamily member 3 n=1 Tax=Camellia lanceoleosa TaxID=1840588 RepID=A0ACC0HE86_9ERIC|nr:Transmembrane 9 superfamily member 3 [Camellia lanceoleosa]